ncbi:MAG: thymidine phosphorylase [Gammaproteobacteria bacterium]|nr:thymidine phosphorylase [Gammaproteobacteria bacterium]
MMLFEDIIRAKRDGKELTDKQIQFFVDGLTNQSISAEQVSSIAMAIFFRSMSFEEAGLLTDKMASSGAMLNWEKEGLYGPVIDKHSTGGVGDKTSFMLAPIAAACGCFVPMIAGRGLGHTGGTIDKLESIEGYKTAPNFDLFRDTVKNIGCAIIGQTGELAPADGRFYSIRDVTATVESVPLITASILSKKIAAGIQGLICDVKVGSGAFMKTNEKAHELANSLIQTAKKANLKSHAIITDMNEVLGSTAGNAEEIRESVLYLTNEIRESRLDDVILSLGSEMLIVGGITDDRDIAREKCNQAITSGKAAEIFGKMIAALGGPTDFIENYDNYLPKAPVTKAIYAEGYIESVNVHVIGNAIIELGGGRKRVDDILDLSVGFTNIAPIGIKLGKDRPLALIHAATKLDAEVAANNLRNAYTLSESASTKQSAINRILIV